MDAQSQSSESSQPSQNSQVRYQQQYQIDNQDLLAQYQQEYQPQYQIDNQDRLAQYQQEYQPQYQIDNQDRLAQYQQQYRQDQRGEEANNPELLQNRRANGARRIREFRERQIQQNAINAIHGDAIYPPTYLIAANQELEDNGVEYFDVGNMTEICTGLWFPEFSERSS